MSKLPVLKPQEGRSTVVRRHWSGMASGVRRFVEPSAAPMPNQVLQPTAGAYSGSGLHSPLSPRGC